MRPVVSYGTDEPTQGFCFCPPPVGWGHYTLAPVDWRDAELARLRADLAEARADVARFEAALDAANKELAQARAERDEAIERRSVTVASEENLRFLKQLWEQECGYYRAKWWASHQANDRSRTIRALVVFGRAAWRSLRTLAGNQARWQMAQLGVKVNMLLISERSKTTHD